MHPVARFIASKPLSQALRFILLVVILSALSFAGLAQTHKIERTVPVKEKTKITVVNAKKITISLADNSEVALVAEVSGAPTGKEEISIQSQDNKLQITCPPPSENSTSLVLRVPARSFLELKIYNQKIEIKNPTEVITIASSETSIVLGVPFSAELELREVGNVSQIVSGNGALGYLQMNGNQRNGAVMVGAPPTRGGGHSQIKVTAKGTQVVITNGFPTNGLPATGHPQSTVAASAIASQNSLMGKALRQAHPELLSSRAADGTPVSNTKESETGALKLETYLVNMNLSVTDREGRAISGLTQNEVSVYEDNILQNISFFSTEKAPFNLVLLLDLSGSVREKIDLIKEAALHFLEIINPQDKVAVYTFTTDVQTVSKLTDDREKLRDRIRNLQLPSGGTAFYDALGYVLAEELRGVKGQRNAVITITDGQDNALLPAPRPPAVQNLIQQQMAAAGLSSRPPQIGSYLTFEQLLDGVLEADTLIYPIYLMQDGFLGMMTNSNPLNLNRQLVQKSEWQLQGLADASGGKLFAAAKVEDLKDAYEQVAAELRTIYSVAYNPKNANFDGKFRRLRVKVNKTEAAVRTRYGYYAR